MENYQTAISQLTSLEKFHINLGLDRVQALLELFGNPQDSLKCIHVAGTNGKGSTCAMLESILRSAGYKTGLYTSPHLVDYTERIKVNGRDISRDEFAEVILRVIEHTEAQKIPATEFEILTVAAFLYFREKSVDFAVMETGLGGRLDATNVIKKPELCIITDIGLDHTARLGGTVEEIASEKAGIIKEAVPVVTLKDNAGLDVIKNKAESSNSRLILSDELDADPSEVALKGLWQRRNLSLVKAGLALLREAGVNVPVEAEKQGLQNVQWRGRFEYIKEENLLIDSAHNPPGAKVLRASLDKYFSNNGRVFVYSSLNTKDFRTVSTILFRQEDVVIVTRNTGHASESPDVIASFLRENRLCREVYSTEHVLEAMELSRKLRNDNDLIVFTGSIYTIGEFLAAKNQ